MKHPLLEVRSLKKSMGRGDNKVEALKSVDFQLYKGEFVAIMGSSGSGKSTLMHILGGMDRPTSGKIYVDGKEINLALFNEPKATYFRREKIGFVFQSFNLIQTLTAQENVALPLVLAGKKKKEIRQASEEMLRYVGLYERREHLPSELSGGQQQRVAVARALITKPEILLADEPTGNLDARTTQDILQLFNYLRDEQNQTTLLVTHDPRVAVHVDRVIFLENGEVSKEWKPEAKISLEQRMDDILAIQRDLAGEITA